MGSFSPNPSDCRRPAGAGLCGSNFCRLQPLWMTRTLDGSTRLFPVKWRAHAEETAMKRFTNVPASRSTMYLDFNHPDLHGSRLCEVSITTGTPQRRAIGEANRLARNMCACKIWILLWR